MKTTKAQFKRFQAEFNRCIEVLGLKEWDVYFSMTKLDDRASIEYRPTAKTAVIYLSDEQPWTGSDPEKSAKHEAVHLLLAEMSTLGEMRDSTHSDREQAEEEVVRVLAKSA